MAQDSQFYAEASSPHGMQGNSAPFLHNQIRKQTLFARNAGVELRSQALECAMLAALSSIAGLTLQQRYSVGFLPCTLGREPSMRNFGRFGCPSEPE